MLPSSIALYACFPCKSTSHSIKVYNRYPHSHGNVWTTREKIVQTQNSSFNVSLQRQSTRGQCILLVGNELLPELASWFISNKYDKINIALHTVNKVATRCRSLTWLGNWGKNTATIDLKSAWYQRFPIKLVSPNEIRLCRCVIAVTAMLNLPLNCFDAECQCG